MLPFPWPCTPKPSLWLSSKTWPCVRFQCESCLSTQKEEDRSRPVIIAQEQTGQCVCFSQRCQSEHALCLGIPSAGVAPAHNTFTHSSLSNSKSSADNSPGLWGGVYLESPKKWRTCDREEIFHKWAGNSDCPCQAKLLMSSHWWAKGCKYAATSGHCSDSVEALFLGIMMGAARPY